MKVIAGRLWTTKEKLWLPVTTCLAYRIDEELYKAIDYLREQARVLVRCKKGVTVTRFFTIVYG